jgi:hypothetical protein
MLSTPRTPACRLIAALGCGDRTGYRVRVSPGPGFPITTIGDDLVLLSVSAGDGRIGSASVLGIGLMGSELVLLAARGRIGGGHH